MTKPTKPVQPIATATAAQAAVLPVSWPRLHQVPYITLRKSHPQSKSAPRRRHRPRKSATLTTTPTTTTIIIPPISTTTNPQHQTQRVSNPSSKPSMRPASRTSTAWSRPTTRPRSKRAACRPWRSVPVVAVVWRRCYERCMRVVSGGRIGRLGGSGRVHWRVPVSPVTIGFFAFGTDVVNLGALV